MQSPSLLLLSGQNALERAMDVVANNVANSSTTAFKREGVAFDSFLTHPATGQSLSFVVDRATYRDMATGPIQPTGNPLDLAIEGEGYFPVQAADGSTKYTRSGAFQINSQGQISTLAGQPVLGDGNRPITVPDTATDINISGDGFITVRVDKGTNLSELGKIVVVKFDKEQELKAQGNGLYATNQLATPAPDSSIVQGALEQSNVKPIIEMTHMIEIQRLYERATNIVGQENTRLTDAINKLSKTTA